MAVNVLYVGRNAWDAVKDGEGVRHGYHVTDAGLLTIVSVTSAGYRTVQHISPGAWVKVDGLRFSGDHQTLQGSAGTLTLT